MTGLLSVILIMWIPVWVVGMILKQIGSDYSLMFDLVLNHVSSSHPWFLNFCAGRDPGKDYFIEKIPGMDYHLVVRPRSTELFYGISAQTQAKRKYGQPSALTRPILILQIRMC